MESSGRRILLAVEPGMLEGALAELLSATEEDQVVQGSGGRTGAYGAVYDAAVVSADLPSDVLADVVITLPDAEGSGGTGTVRRGTDVRAVSIDHAGRIVELLEEYAPHR